MPLTAQKMDQMLADLRQVRKKLGKVELPNRTQIAIIPTIPFEWWGNLAKGRGAVHFKPIVPVPEADTHLNLSEISFREFGGIGASTALDILEDNEVKGSWVTTGNAAARYPDIVRNAAKLGHEFIAHQYDHDTIYPRLTASEEEKDIKKSVSTLESLIPNWPRNGWVSSGWLCTPNTVDFLIKQRFVSHSDFHNELLPYIIQIGDKKIVEVPHSSAINDGHSVGPDEYLRRFKLSFDYLYKQGEKGKPGILNFAMHSFNAGRPHWAPILEKVLRYAKSFPHVWFTTRIEIARWWLANYDGQIVNVN